MNMRREREAIEVTPAIARPMCTGSSRCGAQCLEKSTADRSCFGTFSIADAMFAPVVNRLDVYAFETTARGAAYMDTIKALPPGRSGKRPAGPSLGWSPRMRPDPAPGQPHLVAGGQKNPATRWSNPKCHVYARQISEIDMCQFRPLGRPLIMS
jgi:hypothetical protein